MEVVRTLPYDIDGIKVHNVKTDSRPQLLEAIMKQDSCTGWADYN